MPRFLPRVEALLHLLDRFLALFATMMIEQRGEGAKRKPPEDPPLIRQMALAQSNVVERRQQLSERLTPETVDGFIHRLAMLSRDPAYFEFDLSHLSGADEYEKMMTELHELALKLGIDLSKQENKAVFIAELKGRSRPTSTL